MAKVIKGSMPQMNFLDPDQNLFSSPTAKSVLDSRLTEAQQKTGAPDPDQMLRDFTSKLLSSMGVEPGEDLEASMKQAVLRKQLEECGCPKKYIKMAAEEMKDYPNDNLSVGNYRLYSDFAPAARRIRVLLLKQEHPDWLSVWTDAEQDIMNGKADSLDYHLNPVNPEVFVKKMQEKMQEIKGIKSIPPIILAYTCVSETEYDAVKEEWDRRLSEDSTEGDCIQLGNRLAIYGVYRKYGRFHDLPSELQDTITCLFDPFYLCDWVEVERILGLNSFPFRHEDVLTLEQRELCPSDFKTLKEEEANYVG